MVLFFLVKFIRNVVKQFQVFRAKFDLYKILRKNFNFYKIQDVGFKIKARTQRVQKNKPLVVNRKLNELYPR